MTDSTTQFEHYLKAGWSEYSKSSDWLRFRRKWLLDNPPLDNHCYMCGICGNWVKAEEVTLDHISPRNPENMFLYSNIQPAHGYCNYRKGSQRWTPKVSREQHEFLKRMSDM